MMMMITAAVGIALATQTGVMMVNPAMGQVVQKASDGGLTAAINGTHFVPGNTVTITGNVSDNIPAAAPDRGTVNIEVKDPKNRTVESSLESVINTTFTYSFVAGWLQQFDPDNQMLMSGNYTVEIRHTRPGLELPLQREQVDLVFEYTNSTSGSNSSSTSSRG